MSEKIKESPHQQMMRVMGERNEKKKLRPLAYQESSKKRLIKIAEKKIKTTFIGSIAVIESTIGHLWGHGKPYNKLDEEEKKWRQVWDEMRTEILNNGNTQKRALVNEINGYEISWNRNTISTIIKEQEENNG